MSSSTFCDKCKAVIFDDSREEAYVDRGQDGLESLQIKCGDKDIRRVLAVDYDVKDSYPDLPLLAASAAAGCELCKFLRAMALGPELKASWSKDPWSETPWAEGGLYEGGEARLRIQMWYIWQANNPLPHEEKGLCGLEFGFQFHNDGAMDFKAFISCSIESSPGTCASWLHLNAKEPGYVLSPTVVAWTRERLDAKPCKLSVEASSDDAFVPTRLIRVGCEPARLVVTPHSEDWTQALNNYAALSYCWGPPEQAALQLKTEKSSLEARLSAIGEHEMTSVLKDAIKTCRALSIPYLWVDALCIIQDDVLDWQRESALMGRVYANAYLTICPLSSESCTQGFLKKQPAQLEISFQSKIKPDVTGSYSLRFHGVNYSDYSTYDWLRADFFGSNWEKRGWTFQELSMSNRVLAFGGSNVHFLDPGQWGTQGQGMFDGEFAFQMAQLDAEAGYTDEEDYYRIWHTEVVSSFSTRALTFQKDRFPALSGAAQFFAKVLGDEYAAGLWKKELYRGLFWISKNDNHKTWEALLGELGDSSSYLAPSWSWASRDGPVEFGSRQYSVYSSTECDDYRRESGNMIVSIEPVGVDHFGQVKAASLQITTRVRALPTDMRIAGEEWNEVLVGEPEMPYFARCYIDWQPGAEGEPRREVSMLLLGSAGTIPDSDESEHSDYSEHLGIDSDAGDDESVILERAEEYDCRWVYGLLIYPVGPDTNEFFRVGTFSSPEGSGAYVFRDVPETTVTLI